MTKKKIKLNFVDFYPGSVSAEEQFFRDLIGERFEIVPSTEPDFIFYSVFGHQHLNYNCVRVFYTGENIRPNFNVCDYAFGFDWMAFEDRYYRIPFYRHQPSFSKLTKLPAISQDILAKKKFCNFVYSNGSASSERGDFFDLLSSYKPVDSGGRYKNTLGHLVDDKLQFMNGYKFSISFENVSSSGYTTEKIVDAKVAGSIPIYWGNRNIQKDFNVDSFINCHHFKSFAEVVEHVKFLDNNQEAYLKVANAPLFQENSIPEYLEANSVSRYLESIFAQEPIAAKRRCGLLHERFVERDLKIFQDIKNNPVRYFQYFVASVSKKIKGMSPKPNTLTPRIVE